jgi:hypothetical protein
MGYRYEIEKHPAPDRYTTPNKYVPYIGKIGLSLNLLREAVKHKFNWPVVFSRPCIYGTLSRPVGGFAPVKDKCVACHRCVQEYDFVRVEINPKYKRLGDSYFDPGSVATVVYEASTGEIPVKGMGYRGKFVGKGFDSFWTDMSEIVRPTRDGIYGREYISTAVDIGRKPSHLPTAKNGARFVQIPLPVIFDFLPGSLMTEQIRDSLVDASQSLGNFFVMAADEWANKDIPAGHIIPLMDASDFGTYKDRIADFDFKIVEIRSGGDRLEDVREAAAELRTLNPGIIVAVRLDSRDNSLNFDFDLVNDIDILHVCADYHGRAWFDGQQVDVKDLTENLHRRLVEEGIRDEVTLIVSGGIIRAEHVPKILICGADAVGLDTALLVALQSRFTGDCLNGNLGRLEPRKFNPGWGKQRIMNLMASWRNQLLEVVSAMGIRDVRRLRGERGRAIFYEDFVKRIPVFIQNAESR